MPSSPRSESRPVRDTAFELFPLPLLRLHWESPELNERFEKESLRRNEVPGVAVSNRGGWHSERDLLDWHGDHVARLEAMIRLGLNRYAGLLEPDPGAVDQASWELEAWINVNPPGAWNASHTHTARGNAVSGVYYVRVPELQNEDDVEGAIVFEDHSGVPVPSDYRNARGSIHREHHLHPVEGDMVLFPAWLYHRVEPHAAAEPRISIAFNARHPALAVARYPDMIEPNWRWRNMPGIMRMLARIEEKAKKLGTPGVQRGSDVSGK